MKNKKRQQIDKGPPRKTIVIKIKKKGEKYRKQIEGKDKKYTKGARKGDKSAISNDYGCRGFVKGLVESESPPLGDCSPAGSFVTSGPGAGTDC
jgi:hypothetical protein